MAEQRRLRQIKRWAADQRAAEREAERTGLRRVIERLVERVGLSVDDAMLPVSNVEWLIRVIEREQATAYDRPH